MLVRGPEVPEISVGTGEAGVGADGEQQRREVAALFL